MTWRAVMAPSPQDTQTRSRLIIGENGPSDSALAASSGWRLCRPAAERHAARCASRALCSGGAPWRYPPSKGDSSICCKKIKNIVTVQGPSGFILRMIKDGSLRGFFTSPTMSSRTSREAVDASMISTLGRGRYRPVAFGFITPRG